MLSPESIGNRIHPLTSQIDIEHGALHLSGFQQPERLLDARRRPQNFDTEVLQVVR